MSKALLSLPRSPGLPQGKCLQGCWGSHGPTRLQSRTEALLQAWLPKKPGSQLAATQPRCALGHEGQPPSLDSVSLAANSQGILNPLGCVSSGSLGPRGPCKLRHATPREGPGMGYGPHSLPAGRHASVKGFGAESWAPGPRGYSPRGLTSEARAWPPLYANTQPERLSALCTARGGAWTEAESPGRRQGTPEERAAGTLSGPTDPPPPPHTPPLPCHHPTPPQTRLSALAFPGVGGLSLLFSQLNPLWTLS